MAFSRSRMDQKREEREWVSLSVSWCQSQQKTPALSPTPLLEEESISKTARDSERQRETAIHWWCVRWQLKVTWVRRKELGVSLRWTHTHTQFRTHKTQEPRHKYTHLLLSVMDGAWHWCSSVRNKATCHITHYTGGKEHLTICFDKVCSPLGRHFIKVILKEFEFKWQQFNKKMYTIYFNAYKAHNYNKYINNRHGHGAINLHQTWARLGPIIAARSYIYLIFSMFWGLLGPLTCFKNSWNFAHVKKKT